MAPKEQLYFINKENIYWKSKNVNYNPFYS